MSERSFIIIPAYNEVPKYIGETRLDRVVTTSVKAQEKHIVEGVIVVNDGSTDFTRKKLEPYEPKIKVISHTTYSGQPDNRGKLGAVITGIREARKNGAEIVVLSDTDYDNPDYRTYKALVGPLKGFFGLRNDMTVMDYDQNGVKCGYTYSGLRAIRTSVFEPWFNPSHPDYWAWSHILKPKKMNANELPNLELGQRKTITTGFSLETLLFGMTERYDLEVKGIPYTGLMSRKKGEGACTLDEINAGIDWAAAMWEGLFGDKLLIKQ